MVKSLYQWEENLLNKTPKIKLETWFSDFGPKVISRDREGFAKKVEFNIYIKNKDLKIYLVGDFNNWCEDFEILEEKFRLTSRNNGFATISISNISHKCEYKFLVIEDMEIKYFSDPATYFFSELGNSVFWDFKDPHSYSQNSRLIDLENSPIKILQTDLGGLIKNFKDKSGNFGREIPENQYYNFITNSGICQKIKSLGFNSIQFLPVSQAIDGKNWKFRYLTPFPFAIEKNWGNPDEFAKMIDEFHKNNIAVFLDCVVGHIPYKDYTIFNQKSENYGLHTFKDENSNLVYLDEKTHWGTARPNFKDNVIRSFFIDSCLNLIKNYKIDGFRIDNVDGILRKGNNGHGEERPFGREFLRELNKAIYNVNPLAQIHFEAHYFHGNNAKLLVFPIKKNPLALGATAYNESRLTHFFHQDYMIKTAEKISIWKLKHLIEEKEWGNSNSTIADFHNHDAAAGLMEMRCTGSYCYDTMTRTNPENSFHAIGKIQVMEAIISLFCEGRTLDLLQTNLLQIGSFEHDSTIHWDLEKNITSSKNLEFKVKLNQIMEHSSFWPKFVNNRKVINLDEKNKIIVFQKSSKFKGKSEKFTILINISSFVSKNYKIGLENEKSQKLVLTNHKNSKQLNQIYENCESKNFEFFTREIEIKEILPYEILVFKEI